MLQYAYQSLGYVLQLIPFSAKSSAAAEKPRDALYYPGYVVTHKKAKDNK